jgi:outer membrane lipoprotein SlyB
MRRISACIMAVLAVPILLAAADSKPVIPAGTKIDVQMISGLSSSASHSGDLFTAKVLDPIFIGGVQVVPPGSTLRGHVTFVKPPARVKGKAEMRLVGDGLVTQDGQAYSFTAELTNGNESDVKVDGKEGTVEGPGKSKKQAAKESGVGAAAGAGVGAIAGGGTGALYGAGIGAMAGLIHTLAKHHKDVVINSGTSLVFVLTSPGTPTKVTKETGSTPFICTTCD